MSKFVAGQKVILHSKLFPSLNGDQVVSEVYEAIPGQVLQRTGEPDNSACYILDGIEGYWAEHSLSEA